MAINAISLLGNIGNDCEVRWFTNGDAGVASFSLAVTERYKDKTGEQKEKTIWIPCKVYGPKGRMDYAAKFLLKGQRVAVTGKLEQEEWTDKDTQKKRDRLIVRIDELELAGSGRKSSDTNGAANNAGGARQPAGGDQDFDPSKWEQEEHAPF